MTQPGNPTAGLRNQRVLFYREDALGSGTVASDPTALRYSSSIPSLSWTPGPGIMERRGIGSEDVIDFEKGPETGDATVTYDLIKWFTSGGNANDAAYDGLARDADNRLPNSHTVVQREDKATIAADASISGNTSRPTRLYKIGYGGKIGTVTLTAEPSSRVPITSELAYSFQKIRVHQIDQPTSGEGATEVVVSSSDATDTGVSITIEDEGAATTETVTTDGSNGTTLVSTTATFSDIDVIHISGEYAGDITVAINSGSATAPTAGDDLAIFYGTDEYGGGEYDTGLIPLGAGSIEAALTAAPETFIGDTITRGGSPYPHEIPSAVLTVNNNFTIEPRGSGYSQSIYAGNRNVQLTAPMYGETHTYDLLEKSLRKTESDHVWTLTGGTLTLTGATLTGPGELAYEEGQAALTTENVFTAKSLTIS